MLGIPEYAQASPKTYEVKLTLNQKVIKVVPKKQQHLTLSKKYPFLKGDRAYPEIRPQKNVYSLPSVKTISHKTATRPKPKLAPVPCKGTVQQLAYRMVVKKWGVNNWYAFDQIVKHESGWDPYAVNRSSGACGLGQALPCSKMGGMGVTNQLNWLCGYISGRYGTPNNAWAFWQRNHYY